MVSRQKYSSGRPATPVLVRSDRRRPVGQPPHRAPPSVLEPDREVRADRALVARVDVEPDLAQVHPVEAVPAHELGRLAAAPAAAVLALADHDPERRPPPAQRGQARVADRLPGVTIHDREEHAARVGQRAPAPLALVVDGERPRRRLAGGEEVARRVGVAHPARPERRALDREWRERHEAPVDAVADRHLGRSPAGSGARGAKDTPETDTAGIRGAAGARRARC
jgi:hypothetical protein